MVLGPACIDYSDNLEHDQSRAAEWLHEVLQTQLATRGGDDHPSAYALHSAPLRNAPRSVQARRALCQLLDLLGKCHVEIAPDGGNRIGSLCRERPLVGEIVHASANAQAPRKVVRR